ncbi:MAG: histidine phosphatase family protein [bacterium]|nr:histidine phosphatase family protein [bacterium]
MRLRSCLSVAGALLALLATGPALAVLPAADQPVRNLFLIRHGEYVHDVACDEEVGCGLDALGREQARLVAARLDGLPLRFTSLQSSPLTRARETAAIVAGHFPELAHRIEGDIRECTPPTRRPDIMADLEPGEAAACEAQLAAAAARLLMPAAAGADENDIVVCHGNVIRWLVCRALDVDPQAWLGMSIANCSLTVIQVKADGSCKLVSFADSGHIPWSQTTYPGVTWNP